MSRLVPALLALVLVTSIAAPVFAQNADPAPAPKSEATATALSIGGTLVGPALIALALHMENQPDDASSGYVALAGLGATLVGPSFGHWYAGKAFTKGMALRGAGIVAEVVGFGMFVACVSSDHGPCHDEVMGALVLGGAAATLAGAIWDIATADDQARRWNNEHGLTLSPTPMGADGGGVTLSGRF